MIEYNCYGGVSTENVISFSENARHCGIFLPGRFLKNQTRTLNGVRFFIPMHAKKRWRAFCFCQKHTQKLIGCGL